MLHSKLPDESSSICTLSKLYGRTFLNAHNLDIEQMYNLRCNNAKFIFVSLRGNALQCGQNFSWLLVNVLLKEGNPSWKKHEPLTESPKSTVFTSVKDTYAAAIAVQGSCEFKKACDRIMKSALYSLLHCLLQCNIHQCNLYYCNRLHLFLVCCDLVDFDQLHLRCI